MRLALVTIVGGLAFVAPQWQPQTSGVTTTLRGVSAVSDRTAWASGAGGTILRTDDSGATWRQLTIPGSARLDFRDVDGVGDRVAYALSIGNGESSRIYKTIDAGASWSLQFTNRDPKAFFDAMAFWNADRGIAFSDSIDGQLVILRTDNGGKSWDRVTPDGLPPALENEGAFAASGTNIAVYGDDHVWIGTGAAAVSRVLRSTDRGRTWTAAATPLHAGPSAGIFSVAFRDALRGIVVGGDYKLENDANDNAAITSDGGRTWTLIRGLSGFRSVVRYLPGAKTSTILAVGPNGADYSTDNGKTWLRIEGPGFHTFSFAPSGRFGWAAGAEGRIARLAALITDEPERLRLGQLDR
jgi:photosystem II stability/assembly factor-like uncharacterized protein